MRRRLTLKGTLIDGTLSIPEARRAFTRQEILVRSRRLFADNGIAATSMGDVAKALDITRATLYKYYGSKEEIVQAAIREAMDRFMPFGGGVEASSLREGLSTFVRGHIALIERQGKSDLHFIYRVLIDELGQSGHEALLLERLGGVRNALIEVLRLGRTRKELAKGVDIEVAADDLIGELMGLHLLWLLGPDDYNVMAAADRIADRFVLQVSRS